MGFPDKLFSVLLCACGLLFGSFVTFPLNETASVLLRDLTAWTTFSVFVLTPLLDRRLWSSCRIGIFGFLLLNPFMTPFCLRKSLSTFLLSDENQKTSQKWLDQMKMIVFHFPLLPAPPSNSAGRSTHAAREKLHVSFSLMSKEHCL